MKTDMKIWPKILKGRDLLGELGINDRMVINGFKKNMEVKTWTEIIWCRMLSSGANL
jgi:hypothetical protein